jgi:hypothetical protein
MSDSLSTRLTVCFVHSSVSLRSPSLEEKRASNSFRLCAPLQNYIFLNTRRSACDEDHRQKSTSRKVTNRARAVWTLHLAFDPQQSRCRFARDGNAIAKTF